jgi:hypothetical protein
MGPALPRPHHTRGEAGEQVPLLEVAVVLEMRMMTTVRMVAEMLSARVTAAVAAMPAAGGCVTRGGERGGYQRKRGNGGSEEWSWGDHGLPGG